MKREIANPYPGGKCFFCGEDNAQGLNLKFYHDDELGETTTEYQPEARFVGQGDILHGAIQMGLLDEIMGWASFVHSGELAVTTKMDFRFLRPLHVSCGAVRVVCRVVERAGPEVRMRAELVNAESAVCTTAAGTYRVVTPERYATLVRRFVTR